MATPNERISVLEAFRVTDSMDVKELQAVVERIDKNVQTIQLQMNKQQGFTAGVLFILTPIWALILFFIKDLWARFTGK